MPPHRPPVYTLIGGLNTLLRKSFVKRNPCRFGSKPVRLAVSVLTVAGAPVGGFIPKRTRKWPSVWLEPNCWTILIVQRPPSDERTGFARVSVSARFTFHLVVP